LLGFLCCVFFNRANGGFEELGFGSSQDVSELAEYVRKAGFGTGSASECAYLSILSKSNFFK
jgi:hypothetical protein